MFTYLERYSRRFGWFGLEFCEVKTNSQQSVFLITEPQSKAAISCTLAADAKATSIVSLKVKSLIGNFSNGSSDERYCKTRPTDHVEQVFGTAGFNWNTPFMKRETMGRFPNCCLSTGLWIWEIHALYTLMVLYARPRILNCSSKNAKTSTTGAENGSKFRCRHQLDQSFHGPS